jgi:hypothetical protein
MQFEITKGVDMAKGKQPQKESKSMGTKSARRSAVTIANKERGAETRARRLARAAERRSEPSNRKASRNPRAHEAQRREAARRVEQKRSTRDRLKGLRPKDRALAIERGEIQFGEKAKGYHKHQRSHRLARALTPKEFQEWQESRGKKKQAAQAAKDRADLAFIHHAATGA